MLRTTLLLLTLTAPPPHAQDHDQQGDRPHRRLPLPGREELADLPPDGGDEFNRLVFEDSPYLQQHARNPVDWYPWGAEAFERARAEDKPVFLSIGYSTCHWCHVMEVESFEDEEVAALLNRAFVCIKVDREERPDVDHVFMQVTQAMTGRGGWPMTVVMTPDQRPFFAATYIPKHGRFGRRGMMDLVPLLEDLWKTDRESVLANADEAWRFMGTLRAGAPGDDLGPEVLTQALDEFRARFDGRNGGFGDAPKFPLPHGLLLLLQLQRRAGNDGGEDALEMVTRTLTAMRLGGIYDQLGYGFHRYSTDARWLVPHFEKMLYDQALLTMAYTAGWQVTGEPLFERTAREVIEYVLRDMTSPAGGFYSAEDADSEGEEGLFYLWTEAQLAAVLGAEDAALFGRVYGTSAAGNFRDEASGERTGRNILFLEQLPYRRAAELGIERPELTRRLADMRRRLFEAREARVHPLKDDKVLTGWNGLMIAALARAAQAFGDERYTAAARRAADFALAELVFDGDRVHKRWRDGRAGLPGTLEDHAFLAWGLVELYETVFDVRYLEAALALTDSMLTHFGDAEAGGFFLTADDAGQLLAVRGKEAYDGAIPAGNSVAVWNLLRLARMTGRSAYEDHAAAAVRAHARAVLKNASSHSLLLLAVDFALGPTFEVVVAGDPSAEDTRAMLRGFQLRYVPNKVLLLRPPGRGEEAPPIVALAPFTANQSSSGGATAYVCRNFACKLPTRDVEQAVGFLADEAWAEDDAARSEGDR